MNRLECSQRRRGLTRCGLRQGLRVVVCTRWFEACVRWIGGLLPCEDERGAFLLWHLQGVYGRGSASWQLKWH